MIMATIKSFTSLEQSKRLADILPLESADMYYEWSNKKVHFKDDKYNGMGVSCWSLSALLNVLPAECECMSLEHINYGNNHKKYFMSYVGGGYTDTYDNSVDACVEMILKLNELNLL